MRKTLLSRPVTVAALAAAVVIGPGALAQTPAPGFTDAQATAGKAAYAERCASCHMPDLSGNNDAPALAGDGFVTSWGPRSVKELSDYLQGAMPPGGPSLSTDATAGILAHILKTNGLPAGTRPLDPAAQVPLLSLLKPASDKS